jgi:hypothetical protein
MKKEIIVAIIIGLSVGLIIAFGLWTANKSLKQVSPKNETSSLQIGQPTPTPLIQNLIIDNPTEDFISNQEKITVSGKTISEATVVITYEEGEKILTADSQGLFNTEITLLGGANEIKISAFEPDGNESSVIINGVYSTVEI